MAHHFNLFSNQTSEQPQCNFQQIGYPSQVDNEDTTPPHALYIIVKGVHGELGIRFAAKSVHSNHYCIPPTNHT